MKRDASAARNRRHTAGAPQKLKRTRSGAGGEEGVATQDSEIAQAELDDLLAALRGNREGDFSVRLAIGRNSPLAEAAAEFNELATRNERMSKELVRIGRIIGRDGRMTERAALAGASGDWATSIDSVNSLIDDLVRPTTEVARVLVAVAEGDLSQKMALKIEGQPVKGEFLRIGTTVNTMVDQLSSFADEVTRVARLVGTEGKLGGQANVEGVSGTWKDLTDSVNLMASNLTDQVRNIAQVTTAVAQGDLSQKITVDVKGEILELKNTINTMVDQLSSFADEVTRVAREVGTEGKLGGQAEVEGVSGTWRGLTESVNFMANNLTGQVRNIAQVATAVAEGDLSQKITVEAKGEVAALADTINSMTDTLHVFAEQVTSVAREVGTEGKLGGQAEVPGVAGTWKDLTDSVNFMANNLTDQVRNIAQVTTAVAQGDLSQTITVDVKGEILELKNTINTMVDQLSSFADEVTRVAREVGTEGKLGGQAEVEGVSGTWRGLTESVNFMANNLTGQVRNIAQVTTAVAQGDLSQKITVEAEGEVAALADTINTMVDQLRSFAAEVTRVAREVGTEGKLGGQAEVEGVSGTWRGLTENVNLMASNLTDQVRNIAQVATAVAEGDLSQQITVEAKGEVAALADTINKMVEQLRSFAAEVTRVAREVGTEGKLGGQAEVEGVSGTWRGLTENVNLMASNLTDQVRNIAQVTTAVANGDLSQTITVDAKGEILELKDTINTMVDQLSSFADEVTRVAREVGTEGKLGGQAEVEGVSGTWRGLTENVNQLAGNLTTQVRAIAEVSTAVTQGNLTRSIAVEAQGEVAELKDNINQMIANLRDTTKRNEEQDWLKTNLARISGLMQGQRDLRNVTQLIMSELTPTVSAQHGAFYLAEPSAESGEEDNMQTLLRLIASYGFKPREGMAKTVALGEGLVGQTAVERKSILITDAPPGYIRITSGLGEAAPVSIIVMPILFEERVLGVIELASLQPYSEIHRTFLEQLMATLGVVLNTITANMRTEQLLQQSQSLTQELQTQSKELQQRQEELKLSNTELEQQAESLKASEELLQSQQEKLQRANEELQEKAALLEEQNRDIETKNREIDLARLGLEEKAAQLALSSKYKSEFLANMSHELRTPLNSLLILSKLLQENDRGNLSEKELEFARTIHTAGTDLLQLISDILDLSKIEAGKMEILPDLVGLADVQAYVTRTFDPIAADKGLAFDIDADPALPEAILTDEQRLEQILRNLLSNAFKFTEHGGVTLQIRPLAAEKVSFAVSDTGVGVAPEKLQVIFEAFQQADGTTSRKYGGTGLGLSISRELARALGGEIAVSSTVGQGTTFTLILPMRYARPIAPPPEPSEDLDGGPSAPELISLGAPPPQGAPAPIVKLQAVGEPRGAASEQAAGLRGAAEHSAASARRVLVAERGSTATDAISSLAQHGADPLITTVGSTREAAEALDGQSCGCVVTGPGISKAAAFRLLELLSKRPELRGATFIMFPDRRLTPRESGRLRRMGSQLAAKAVDSREQLTAEAAIALHRSGPWRLDGSPAADEQHDTAALPGRKVLLVDDDVRNLFALASLLEDRGMEVVFGETGKEALSALERHQDIDIVLMDIMMPDMDGNETIAAIRKTPGLSELPIVAVTAKAMEGDRQRSLEFGASDYITKPVEPERLLALIGTWLGR
jgi:HAMP domain-containing protein/signal transduction histidine kinase/CheY-like chemotaxis protein